MKDSLVEGLSKTARYDIDADRTIGFMGEDLRVYATPKMVRDIEETCRNLIYENLDEGEDSVGVRVEIDHLGPTLIGMWVDVTSTITEIDGQRVTMEVEVRDALDKVGRARHTRFVIDKARQKERLEAKRAKVKELSGE